MNIIEIKNAVIKSATITNDKNGYLSAWLQLDYGVFNQGFGGWILYLPESYKHHKIESIAGHFIFRVMEIAEVIKWEDLKGKSIRVKAKHGKIYKIGHIIKDDWFNPSKDFEFIKH